MFPLTSLLNVNKFGFGMPYSGMFSACSRPLWPALQTLQHPSSPVSLCNAGSRSDVMLRSAQGVPADFLARNEEYVSASANHKPAQVLLIFL